MSFYLKRFLVVYSSNIILDRLGNGIFIHLLSAKLRVKTKRSNKHNNVLREIFEIMSEFFNNVMPETFVHGGYQLLSVTRLLTQRCYASFAVENCCP